MEKNLLKVDSRNYGIDLLRIVCMIMIPVLHVLGNGGVLSAAESSPVNYYVAWFLEIACYCAVNCFAIISGYVGYGRKVKYSNIINMHFQVSFYTIIITAIFFIINPANINFHNIMTAVFPAAFLTYWYFSAYFALFFIMPFLNLAVEKFDRKTMKALLISMFFMFSLLPTLLLGDLAGLQQGYCFLWLAVMYTVGAYIKKYGVGINNYGNRKNLLLYGAFLVLTWVSKVIIEILTKFIFKTPKMGEYLIKYTSPTIIACAVFLFLFFANLKCGKVMSKAISFFAPVSFGVYLIHVEPLVFSAMSNKFASFASLNTVFMVLAVIGTSLAIWLVCSLIDRLRLELFKLFKIKELSVKIEKAIGKVLRKSYSYLKSLMLKSTEKV